MPNRVRRQTAPGVEAAGDSGAGSDTRPPSLIRWQQAWHLWLHTRQSRGRTYVPLYMPVPSQLVLQRTTRTGTGMVPVYTAVNPQGDSFQNSSNAVLQFFNNTSGPFRVFVIAQQTCQQGYFHNYVQDIQPGQSQPTEIGPFDFHYNNFSGVVNIQYVWGQQGIQSGVTVALVGP